MLVMIALVTLFGCVIAAMALTPMAAELLKQDERDFAAAKLARPVSLAEHRSVAQAVGGSNEPQAA
jgi:hypothetical protein